MKKILYIISLATLALFCSCSKGGDDDNGGGSPSNKPSTPTISIIGGIDNFSIAETTGATSTFSFSASDNWTITTTDTKAVPTWFSVSPTSGGKGSHTITVTTTQANENYDDRNGYIKITSGSTTKYVTITQKKKEAILISKDKYEVEMGGGAISVEVKANVDYTVDIKADWIKKSSTKALKTSNEVFTIEASEEKTKREGEIVFKSGSLSETVTVYQAGGEFFVLSNKDYKVSDKGEIIKVEIRSNIDYSVDMPNVDWIKESTTKGASSYTKYYDISPNETYDSRTATIVFRAGSKVEEVTITQAQKDAIVIAKKEYVVESKGEIIEVKLSANVDVNFEISDDAKEWMSQVVTRGLTERTLRFNVAANDGYDPREGTITFTGGGVTQTISVVQAQKDAIVIAPNVYEVEPDDTTLSIKIAANVDVNVSITEKDNWISQIVTRGLVEQTLKFHISTNIDSLDREGTITFTGGGVTQNVTIKQKKMPHSRIMHYTSSDGNIVTPYVDGAFIHNEYKDGRGTFILDKNTTSIKGETFYQCSTLTSIEIPDSIKSIGNKAFAYCFGLTEFSIPDNVISLGSSLFSNCTNLITCTIGNGAENIGDNTFENCVSLESVTIGDGVKSIGSKAFYDCASLSNVTFTKDSKLDNIKYDAFSGCSSLTSINIPEGVTSIGSYAFEDCTSLATVTFEEGSKLTTIGGNDDWNGVFSDCSSLTSINIPEKVTNIGNHAFNNCRSLTSINIPENVTSIGHSSFAYCRSLTDIIIPDGVTSIGEWAFSSCSKLATIIIPEGVTSIGSYAFSSCSSLKSINIPENVTSIGYAAFCDCSSLKSVYCKPTTPPTLGANAFFSNASGRKIYVPAASLDDYKTATNWSSYSIVAE